jgi:hypothetical protein
MMVRTFSARCLADGNSTETIRLTDCPREPAPARRVPASANFLKRGETLSLSSGAHLTRSRSRVVNEAKTRNLTLEAKFDPGPSMMKRSSEPQPLSTIPTSSMSSSIPIGIGMASLQAIRLM